MKSFKLALMGVSLLSLMACSKENPGQSQNQDFDVSLSALSTPVDNENVSSYDFGQALPKGQAVSSKQFTFSKSATATEHADSTISLENTDGGFSLTATSCNRQLTKASEKCYARINFLKKDVVGSYTGALKIGPAGAEKIIALSATVIEPTPPPGSLKAYIGSALITSDVEFGELDPNKSAVQNIAIKNESSYAQSSMVVSMDASSNFVKSTDGCHGIPLGAGKTCYIKITFKSDATAPTSAEDRFTNLAVNSDVALRLKGSLKAAPVVQPALADVKVYEGSVEKSASVPVEFGSINQSTAPFKTLTLKNLGTGPSDLLNLSVSGSSRLSLSYNGCSTSLAAGATCYVRVTLTAGSGQVVDESVSGSFAFLNKNINISGNIIGVPAKVADVKVFDGALEVSTYDFGTKNSGSSAYKIFTVKNMGDGATSATPSISVSGPGFSISSNSCVGALGAGKSCSVKVDYLAGVATTEDTNVTGALSVMASSVSLTAKISGEVPKVSDVRVYNGSVEVSSFDLGAVDFGSNAYKIFTVKNIGNGPSTIQAVSISGEGFSISSNGCAAPIAASGSCSVRINFTPTSSPTASQKTGRLDIGSKFVDLLATANADIPKVADLKLYLSTSLITSLDFGSVSSSTTLTKIITLKNEGTASSSNIGIAVGGWGYSLVSHTCTAPLAIGKSCTIRASFQSGIPDADTQRDGFLQIYNGLVESNNIPLQALEKAPLKPSIKFYDSSLKVTSLPFGEINGGSVKTISKNIMVMNEGEGALGGASVSLTPSNAGFSITSNNCGATLSPNRSCYVRVLYSSASSSSATLSYGGMNLNISGTVNIISCASNEHDESGVCISNNRSCSSLPENIATGSQTWSGGNWGSCIPSTCVSSYHLDGQSCVSDIRQCSPMPDHAVAGVQNWNGDSWGECGVSQCSNHYVASGSVCVGESLSLNISKTEGGQIFGSTVSLLNSQSQSVAQNFLYSSTNTEALEAVPLFGFHFVSWSGDCASAGTNSVCVVPLNSSKNISATFERNYVNITFASVNGFGGYVQGFFKVPETVTWVSFASGSVGVIPQGSEIKLTAIPDSGKEFLQWVNVTCANNFSTDCIFTANSTLPRAYAEFGESCPANHHVEQGVCTYNYRACPANLLTSTDQHAQSGNQHYENGNWANACTIASCVNGYNVNEFQNICEPSSVSYSAVYSSPSACSANVACMGAGVRSRTLTGCRRMVSGVFHSNVDVGNCAIYDIPELRDIACSSPQGSINVNIDNGYKNVSCAAGSTVQTLNSMHCNNLYSPVGETCVAQKLLTVTQPIINSNQIKVTVASHVNEALSSLYIDDSSTVQLTVSLGANFSFLGWTGDCQGQGATCSLSMTANKTVGANIECPSSGYQLQGNNCVSTLSAGIVSLSMPAEYVSISMLTALTSFSAAPSTYSTTGLTSQSGTGSASTSTAQTPSGAGVTAVGAGSASLGNLMSSNSIVVTMDTSGINSCTNPYISLNCTNSTVSFASSGLASLSNLPFLVNLNNAATVEIPYNHYKIEQVVNLSSSSDTYGINSPWIIERSGSIYFRAVPTTDGSKLFKKNLSTGVVSQISNTAPGADDNPGHFTLYNGDIYFFATDPQFNSRLFKVNSQDQVVQVSKLNANGSDVYNFSAPGMMTVFNNELFYAGYNSSGNLKVMKYNSTTNVITQMSNIRSGASEAIYSLTPFNGDLYFIAANNSGNKYFKMTPSGVINQITNFRTASDFVVTTTPIPNVPLLVSFNNELYFMATSPAGFSKLFKINTQGAITQVSNLRGSTLSDVVFPQIVFNGELYFTGTNSSSQSRLFKINSAGTITTVNNVSSPTMFAVYESELYFYQSDGTRLKMFKLNTKGEVTQVTNINGSANNDIINNPTVIGSDMYFMGTAGSGSKIFKLKKN